MATFKLLDTFIIDDFYVTQNYMSNPSYYAQFGLKGHEGVDFGHKNKQVRVRTPLGGTAFVGTDKAYGNFVVIEDYKQGCGIYLCHLINVSVVSGQVVNPGDVIGEMDDTGNANGEHVHFNLIILDAKGNKKYNSKQYNYGYLDPKYPRDNSKPISFPGVENYSVNWVLSIGDTPGGNMGDLPANYPQIIHKSSQWDRTCEYYELGKPEETNFESLKSKVAGYLSRITTLEDQVKNPQSVRLKAADGVEREAGWYVAEWFNREEQVSRLKQEVIDTLQREKTLSDKLKNVGKAENAYITQLEGELSLAKARVEELSKERGGMIHQITELENQLANLQKEYNKVGEGQLVTFTVGQLLTALWRKISSQKVEVQHA